MADQKQCRLFLFEKGEKMARKDGKGREHEKGRALSNRWYSYIYTDPTLGKTLTTGRNLFVTLRQKEDELVRDQMDLRNVYVG